MEHTPSGTQTPQPLLHVLSFQRVAQLSEAEPTMLLFLLRNGNEELVFDLLVCIYQDMQN